MARPNSQGASTSDVVKAHTANIVMKILFFKIIPTKSAKIAFMEALTTLNNQVIPHSTLSGLLQGYARPNDKINRLTQQGELITLKKGLYALNAQQAPSKELIANHLHGPSYISRQWALAYYGLMTESVLEITSMCIGRSQQFENAFGRFSYQAIPARYYSSGLTSQHQRGNTFIIATSEKALCDLLLSVRYLRLQSTGAVLRYLLDDLRLDEDDLLALDRELIASFGSAHYKTGLLENLAAALKVLHD